MKWQFKWSWFFNWTGYKQVKIKITRLDVTDHGIFGHLTLDDGSFDCVTLERHDICIPTGEYKVVLYDSPRWGFKVPMLLDVPGRSNIEIHPGNAETDSEGCILIGKDRRSFIIEFSRDTFSGLMAALQNKGNISVIVV